MWTLYNAICIFVIVTIVTISQTNADIEKMSKLNVILGKESSLKDTQRFTREKRSLDGIGGGNLLGKRGLFGWQSLDGIGGGNLLGKRELDSIGGGNLLGKRGLDSIGGGNLLGKRGLDSIGGGNLMGKRGLDSIGGGNLLGKRGLDSIGGGNLIGKRGNSQYISDFDVIDEETARYILLELLFRAGYSFNDRALISLINNDGDVKPHKTSQTRFFDFWNSFNKRQSAVSATTGRLTATKTDMQRRGTLNGLLPGGGFGKRDNLKNFLDVVLDNMNEKLGETHESNRREKPFSYNNGDGIINGPTQQ